MYKHASEEAQTQTRTLSDSLRQYFKSQLKSKNAHKSIQNFYEITRFFSGPNNSYEKVWRYSGTNIYLESHISVSSFNSNFGLFYC